MKIVFKYSQDGSRIVGVDSIIAWLFESGQAELAYELIRRADEAFEIIERRVEALRDLPRTTETKDKKGEKVHVDHD